MLNGNQFNYRRLSVYYFKERFLIPGFVIVTIAIAGIAYVWLINWNLGFKHDSYSRAQVLSGSALHSDTNLPRIQMNIMLPDGRRLQTTGDIEWISTLDGDIICIELKRRVDVAQPKAYPVSIEECEQLPIWTQ